MSKPKILMLDIETVPGQGYLWSLFDNFVPLERLIAPGRVVCWAAQWYGSKEVHFGAEWHEGGAAAMLGRLHTMMTEADAIITYNGDKFDLPKLHGEFIRLRLPPLPKIPSIDLYRKAKKLGLMSGKLEYVAKYFNIGQKIKTAGFRLWVGVMNSDPKDQARMERYNKQDTRLLGRLYRLMRPYLDNHPYLGIGSGAECPHCGSRKVHKRGIRRTKAFFIERLHCRTCGAWSDGKRTRVPRLGGKR